MKEQFYSYIQNLQDQIVAGLEAVDGHAKFRNLWERRKVEGRTVIEMALFFEKAE
jgi:coproporphyrinogen III oxidase